MKFRNIIFTLPFLFLIGCIPQSGGGAGGGSGSMIGGIIPFVLIFVLFYFLILRPQQKQTRERENMIKNLKRGDDVLTNGGIYGKITNINEDILSVEIAKGINIKMTRNGIASLANESQEEKKS
ncbi:MAG: preprotein translocase subunit YajC [Candidatus Dadabacteria bacterium]|nr:preprotein translocase subunit YajC [Candidatus Dadabacteria bacterium]NIS10178.1 preprotein translocase subunit YajC [Candidatus Dadabacteria bacterium]NIY23090.1 preprotein translocase subunit YajC [Candidatus Dadabacteria bacterium]